VGFDDPAWFLSGRQAPHGRDWWKLHTGITNIYGTFSLHGRKHYEHPKGRSIMKQGLVFALIFTAVSSLALASPQEKSEVADRVVSAAVVLKEIMGTPDRSIPQDLLDGCQCVAVIPSMKKGAFIFGGNYGKGAISCRTDNGNGPWSAPSMIMISGGSFGLQIGVQATDLCWW
jgi:hypothetical protein